MTQTATMAPGASRERSGAEIRLLNRVCAELLLDLVAINRGSRHVLDALLLAAISQANVAEITRRTDLQLAYAEADTVPPDELRRPVSVNALASSLGLPFETARRRVKGLLAMGACVQVDGGVIVPSAVVSTPEYYQGGARAYERLRQFYFQLVDFDLLPTFPEPVLALAPSVLPLRVLARLATDYVLRLVDSLVKAIGDVTDALIVIEIFRNNEQAAPLRRRGGDGLAAEDMLPDAERRPIAISAVAQLVGLPAETVRRRAHALEARGVCRRVTGGVIVPAAAMATPEFVQAMRNNLADVQRLFSALNHLGVLSLWDSQRRGDAAPAGVRST